MGILQAMARVKAPLHESLASPPVNFILVVGEGEPLVRMLCPVQSILEAKVGVAMAVTPTTQENTKMLNQALRTLVVAVVEGLEKAITTLTHTMVLLAAAASCASGCTRRARERGKDNYAVIQEKNEDGGIHSAVQQGAPQHRRHHNGAHTAPPGGGLGLAVGAGVLGLPVRAAVAHIPAEDGAEET